MWIFLDSKENRRGILYVDHCQTCPNGLIVVLDLLSACSLNIERPIGCGFAWILDPPCLDWPYRNWWNWCARMNLVCVYCLKLRRLKMWTISNLSSTNRGLAVFWLSCSLYSFSPLFLVGPASGLLKFFLCLVCFNFSYS